MVFKFTTQQQGEILIFLESFLWSFFPIMTLLTVSGISPLYALSLTTLASTFFFGSIVLIQGQWRKWRHITVWKEFLIMTLLLGILFYFFVFTGLKYTTSGNASIILLMEVFFTFFILRLWGKEYPPKGHVIGATFMLLGAFLVIFKGTLQLNPGDLLILVGTAIPPIGNYFMQILRKNLDTVSILFLRSLISGIFLLVLSWMIGEITPLSLDLLPYILINGILLFGFSKILWVEAIHRIPVTKAISLNAITPPLTLLFSYLLLQQIPTIWQICGVLPIIIGVLFLTDFGKKQLS